MLYNEVYRRRVYRATNLKTADGDTRYEPTGWDLVRFEQGGEAWEPQDYIPITGASIPTEKQAVEPLFLGRQAFVPGWDGGVAGLLVPAAA